MVRSVLSLVRGADAGAARADDPALDVNAFAVANDVDLTLVLSDRAVELALARADSRAAVVAGREIPSAHPEIDLTALVGSGVRVYAVAEDLAVRGLGPDDLLDGVATLDRGGVAELLRDHDVTLTTASEA